MNATSTSPTIEPHEPHWVSKAAFPVVMAVFYITQIALGVAVYHSLYWLAIPLVLLSSHLMHGALIGLHEASHGLLRKKRLLNEIDGTLIAAFSITSFSLYRVVHQSHHAHLATERDEELWPFVLPKISRRARILAVVLELGLGFLYTQFLFVRAFLRPGSSIRRKDLRRRIRLELWMTAALWTVILAAVAWWGLWKYLFWLYLAPAWLAGNMQSLRKYIEHVGLTGATINSSTRSIVAHGWLGKLVAFSLLHEPFHGVHHKHSGLPHAKLPQFVAILDPVMPDERPPFPNYRQAFRDLFQSLADPRVGAQWNAAHLEPSRHLTKVG
ncbi:MAG TPA: fatty acid desaturase [Terrimicrobiaceae bacterium]